MFGVHRLLDELTSIVAAFKAKSEEFAGILKVGRTQLQDAVDHRDRWSPTTAPIR